MSNHCNRQFVCSLVIDTIDSLEQVARTRELTNLLWDTNFKDGKTKQEWNKIEVLLESYEKLRDESLEAAMSNLKDLARILSCSAE